MAPLAPVPPACHSNIVAARELQRMAPLVPVLLVLLRHATAPVVASHDCHVSALRRVSSMHGEIQARASRRA